MKLQRLTWEQFDQACLTLASNIKAARTKFSGIYGIPRGGLVVAVKLSHLLDLPFVLDIRDTKWNTLVVDDIADTGKTLAHQFRCVDHHLGIATLFYHKQSVVVPEFWLFEKTSDWVIFPWEQMKCYSYFDGDGHGYCSLGCQWYLENWDCPYNHKEEKEIVEGSPPT